MKLDPVRVVEKPFGTLGLDINSRTTLLAFVTKDAKVKDMVVAAVVAGSAAEQAGIKAKDEVLSIDGVVVPEMSIRQITELWHQKEVGDVVRLQVYRPSTYESRFVDLRVERKKKPDPESSAKPKSGPAIPAGAGASGPKGR